jgi:hypothetical protein
MVSMLRAALEHGDTGYQCIPLFSLAGQPAVGEQDSCDSLSHKLAYMHDKVLKVAGVISEKNTHLWRIYAQSVLADNG